MYKLYLILFFSIYFLSACVHTNRINARLLKSIKKDSILRTAHYGIAVWDKEKNNFIVRHQSDRYFVPASNVKIATLYAALKNLSDTLPSFDYYQSQDTLFILPKGDPSLLDADFGHHAGFNFLKQVGKPVVILPVKWETAIYGKGWAWDDYSTSYMPEKSPLPVNKKDTASYVSGNRVVFPSLQEQYERAAGILSDTLELPVLVYRSERIFNEPLQTLYASSKDSLCKKMMFRSDNLIAEQLLLMVSNQQYGMMNETKIIDAILSDTSLKFPQKPVWVDGSGLSRYNLFSPEDFVYLLKKSENELGIDRIKKI